MVSIALAVGISVLLLGVVGALIACAGLNDPAPGRDGEGAVPLPDAPPGAVEVFKV